ncbi:MAG: ATP-binding protein, partial [Pirellula sp.]
RDSVDITIYTPGSNIGVPMTVLKSFDAPPPAVRQDAETMREKVSAASSGLLTLLGLDSDPLTSREHILLSNIFDKAWSGGSNLSLEELIRQIQSPPIKKIGVIDLESFFPASERVKLAMSLNNLLASPAFAGWLEGQPLDVKSLLYTPEGKPRLSIISIAHLNDSERMFFVTIFLGELLSWMRSQPGTGSLRALFYMDEVYGYFPPSAKPPSKPPMLTLLKQARAFGLGIVLATQNPVDLDYKGLSNMGTWFLGRLQTQRDKDRVLDGLEGASLQQGSAFDRAEMERSLSALGNRVFLMNNVHDDGPTIFQSRWALSFLRGPLSRDQISKLMADKRNASASKSTQRATSSAGGAGTAESGTRPIVPADVTEKFLIPTKIAGAKNRTVYRPAVLGQASIHYVKSTASVDHWQDMQLLVDIQGEVPNPLWDNSTTIEPDVLQIGNLPEDGFLFSELPVELSSSKNFSVWEKELKDYFFRHVQCTVYSCKAIKKTTAPGMNETDARIELSHAAKEARDEAIEKLKTKFADKLRTLQTRLTAAQQRLDKEKEEAKSKQMEGFFNIGTTILGALLGNKIATKGNVSKAASAVRGLGKATTQQGDVMRAQETLEELSTAKQEIETQCEEEVRAITDQFSVENLSLEAIDIPIRKGDTKIKLLALVWVPWQVDPQGIASTLIG